MANEYYVCGKCNNMCERVEVKHTDVEEFWGAPANRDSYEDLSDCCNDDCHTVEEWVINEWPLPDLPEVDLIEYGFIPEPPSAA